MLKRLAFALVLALALAAPAQAADPIMPLSDVHSGMHCTGLTVVRGTAISQFDVEVLDVITGDPAESGPRILIRVSGPAVAASGIAGFKKMYGAFADIAPLRSNITIEDVGRTAVYLASDLSSAVTGEVVYVDGGFNILGVPSEP